MVIEFLDHRHEEAAVTNINPVPQSPRGSIESEGLRSTGRVLRDAAIAGAVVKAALEIGTATGYVTPEAVAAAPNAVIAATGLLTVVVRLIWKWLGKYNIVR